MKKFLMGLAYFLIYSTPVGIGFLLWVIWIITTTDHTIMSLSTDKLFVENIPILKELIFTYFWFFKPIYNFFWQFPAIILTTVKLFINTWLGFWLLPIAKNIN